MAINAIPRCMLALLVCTSALIAVEQADLTGTWKIDIDATTKLLEEDEEISEQDKTMLKQFLPMLAAATIEFSEAGERIVTMPGQEAQTQSYTLTTADGVTTMSHEKPDGSTSSSVVTLTEDGKLHVLDEGKPMIMVRTDTE